MFTTGAFFSKYFHPWVVECEDAEPVDITSVYNKYGHT